MAILRKRQPAAPVSSNDESDEEMQNLDIHGDDESQTGSEEEDEDDEEVKLPEPSMTAVYYRDAIEDKLKDIRCPENVEWIHKLSLDIAHEKEVDVNDDLARELAFYAQALEGTRQAFVKFESIQSPFLRPPDYYAEMVKTEAHMVKIKGRLLSEKRKVEEAEERRKARASKKIAKEVQAEKLKERSKQKKEEIESVKKWRKQREKSGFAAGEGGGMGLSFGDETKPFQRSNKKRPGVSPGDRSGGKMASRQGGGGKGFKGGAGGGNKKKGRDFKDEKFGFGGRKGMKKQNTAETTNDIRGFNRGGKRRKT